MGCFYFCVRSKGDHGGIQTYQFRNFRYCFSPVFHRGNQESELRALRASSTVRFWPFIALDSLSIYFASLRFKITTANRLLLTDFGRQ